MFVCVQTCSVSCVQGFYSRTRLIIWFWTWFWCCSSSGWRLSGSFTVRQMWRIELKSTSCLALCCHHVDNSCQLFIQQCLNSLWTFIKLQTLIIERNQQTASELKLGRFSPVQSASFHDVLIMCSCLKIRLTQWHVDCGWMLVVSIKCRTDIWRKTLTWRTKHYMSHYIFIIVKLNI